MGLTALVGKILALAAAVALLVGVTLSMTVQDLSLGSVSATNEYQATSTAASAVYGASTSGDFLVKTGKGTFGSFVITGAATGIVNFYDATTTDASARARATSTILIASFPASTVAGTYTFDVEFYDGLLMFVESGTIPTTTVTWRR